MNQVNEIVSSNMKFKMNNRQHLSIAIIFFYLLPLLFFASYSIGLMSHHKSWSVLSFGLLLIACGSLSLILLVYYWELALKEKIQTEHAKPSHLISFNPEKENKVTSLDSSHNFSPLIDSETLSIKDDIKDLSLLETNLKESQSEQMRLEEEVQCKSQKIEHLTEENQLLSIKAQQTIQDFADYKLFSEEQLKQRQLQINVLQQMIEDQRGEMEKRQDQIYQLDTKVHDLSYEIKTLLYLHETESAPAKKEETFKTKINGPFLEDLDDYPMQAAFIPSNNHSSSDKWIRSAPEANILLKKCITMAQKLTGANYYSNEATRYREFSSSNYAIDQRRLFDGLRNEEGGLIVVYSQKEHKLLFANQQSKTLLGWSPDKFTSDFSTIIQEGSTDWKRGLNTLTSATESQIRLLAKNKNGQEILLSCHLGIVPSGLFRNHIIGVLYPT